MRKLNKFISAFVVSVVCFVMSLLISTNCTYMAEAAEKIQDISAAGAAVVTDNSDLSVRVVLCSNGEQSTIFTGKLKNYDNGRWVGLDFSEVQSWAIVNWGDSSNDVRSIIPENTFIDMNREEVSLNSSFTDEIDTIGVEAASGTVTCNAKLVYDNIYCEKVIRPNKTLTALMALNNTGTSVRNVICYMAEYDSTGSLINLTAGAEVSVMQGSTNVQAEKTFSAGAAAARLFFWDKNSMQPLCESVDLTSANEDYYSNTFETADEYDISRAFEGNINDISDVDYIKFRPNADGKYLISFNSENSADISLYNSQNVLLKSETAFENGKYIKEELTAEQTYYIRVSGASAGSYKFSVKQTPGLLIGMGFNEMLLTGAASNPIGYSQTANVTIVAADGETTKKSVSVTADNESVSAVVPVGLSSGQYKVFVCTGNKIQEVIDLKLLADTVNFNVKSGEYCSVPFITADAALLNDVYFSLGYSGNNFEIYDVCDYTQTIENGKGIINTGYINVIEKTDSLCVFKSMHTSKTWLGAVNSIRLKAKQNANMSTSRYVYTVQ